MGTILDECIQKGIAIGEAKGEAKGEVAARRAMLLDLLTSKFGELATDRCRTIADASNDDLVTCLKRVIFASTLDEVFTPRS